MAKAVLLGGNGYIGRATNEAWMKADPETEFYVISRSGRNKLTDKRIHNLRADVSDYEEVKAVLPEDFDYIVDFVGAPENDPEKFKRINVMPAKVMKRLAEEYKAKKMGFIAGRTSWTSSNWTVCSKKMLWARSTGQNRPKSKNNYSSGRKRFFVII